MKVRHPVRTIIRELKRNARPDQLAGMARFGIVGRKRLGISIPILRSLAKRIGRDHGLALKLWRTGIPEAQILAALVDEPSKVTLRQAAAWVADIGSWDVCDQLCMNLLDRTAFAHELVRRFAKDRREFVRRAAFSLIASLASHDKKSPDAIFAAYLPLLRRYATDERNCVRKAVNWALRGIGKRNRRLNRLAIKEAKKIQRLDSRTAKWIAADALRELRGEAVQNRLK